MSDFEKVIFKKVFFGNLEIAFWDSLKKNTYVDDNTSYVTAGDIDGVINSLENASNILFKWLSSNLFKGNADKCVLLVNVKMTLI